MKKLSDYRIREENGKFVVEGRIEITERRFLRKLVNFEWHGLNVYGEVAGFCHKFDGSNVKIYTTLEDAKAQIIKWCEDPKYHYVKECDCGLCFSDEACKKYDALFLGNYAKCFSDEKNKIIEKDARDIIFINEALEINPLFYKLVEKYEEKVKTGWNPKTIEKSYADLVLENFELTIKNKELEIQLHELKKKQNK